MYRTWPEKSVRMSLSRSIHGMIWQYSGWFASCQTNLSLRLLPSSSLPNCEELSIDWCFRLCFGLSCFTHFVLLQLLIKHKARVNEMSSKHLPHYGFCYVRNYEWEPVFLIQKRKTARIKDVNKSQGKLIANLSSLVWLYFYYKVLSRSFLEMFKKKYISCYLCEFSWNLPSHGRCTLIGLSVPGEQCWDFSFHPEPLFFSYAVQHIDMGYGSGSAAGTWMWEHGWSLVEETFKGSWCLSQVWALYAESSASPAQIQAWSNNADAEPQSAVSSVQHSRF